MDVFLVPVGAERYELYCEVPDEPDHDVAEPPPGFFRRLVHRFKRNDRRCRARAAPGQRRSPSRAAGSGGSARARCAGWRKPSPSRGCSGICASRRLPACTILTICRRPTPRSSCDSTSTATSKKHRRWLAIDSVLMVLFGVVLFAVPGPEHRRLLLRVPRRRTLSLLSRRAPGPERGRLDATSRARR